MSTDPAEQFWDLYAYAGNGYNPINAVDPDGYLVSGLYSKSTGELSLTNLDNGKSITVLVESGNKPTGDPIPAGNWEILQHSRRIGFFRLDAIDGQPRNDTHEETGRGNFRLHVPGNTTGCVAVKGWKEWGDVEKMLQSTSTTTVEENVKPSWWKFWKKPEPIVKYGTVEIVD